MARAAIVLAYLHHLRRLYRPGWMAFRAIGSVRLVAREAGLHCGPVCLLVSSPMSEIIVAERTTGAGGLYMNFMRDNYSVRVLFERIAGFADTADLLK